MNTPDEQTYFVIPLSVQSEGSEYLIGNGKLEEFYQFPAEGLKIIQLLQRGENIANIKRICAEELSESVDVDDFITLLLDIEFIFRPGEEIRYYEKIKETGQDKRWTFKARPQLAKAFFSLPALGIYLAIIGYAIWSAIQMPQLRFNPSALYFPKNVTIALVSLLILQFFTVVLHEFGHMLAAARHGIDSKVGLGTRLWIIVVETDLSGLFALPKNQRYLPMWAGMLVDVLTIALLTLFIKFLFAQEADGFFIQLMQALILQVLFTIVWQFNIFIRTDVYFVLCNYFSYPNLDSEARVYVKNMLNRLSFGLFGQAGDIANHPRLHILKLFSVIWLLGRVFALSILFFVIFPTVFKYGLDMYQALTDASFSTYSKLDISLFCIISTSILGCGLYFWAKEKRS